MDVFQHAHLSIVTSNHGSLWFEVAGGTSGPRVQGELFVSPI